MADAFRQIEKQYRHRGEDHKNSRQRFRDRGNVVDYSDVIHVHNMTQNTPVNQSRIRKLALPPVSCDEKFTILDQGQQLVVVSRNWCGGQLFTLEVGQRVDA